ncbi:MAG: tetratricopeptide repeat protein [Armatimonadota bacterium]
MGRFDHLEMSNWSPELETPDPNSGTRDENYYKEQADEAFINEDYERALAYYSRALQYNISLEECWLGQLRCLIELWELQEAVVWSNRALEKFPKSAQLLAARAVAECRMGHTESAMGYSDGAFSEAGVNTYCWIARGEVLLSKNYNNAKACFAKAIELAPNDWSIRAAIGHAFRVRKSFTNAYDYFKQAVKLDSDRAACWYWLGKCAESLGEIDEAATAYKRALMVSSSYKKALDDLYKIENKGLFSRMGYAIRRLFKRK